MANSFPGLLSAFSVKIDQASKPHHRFQSRDEAFNLQSTV
jgi:hypothetical protein